MGSCFTRITGAGKRFSWRRIRLLVSVSFMFLRVALTFYWSHEQCSRSVRIEGSVEKLSKAESEAYFSTRPKGSQIGAWSSLQSTVVKGGREELEKTAKEFDDKFENVDVVPMPEYWGGYILKPNNMEFWQGRPNRLHDRLEFTLVDGKWEMKRLSP